MSASVIKEALEEHLKDVAHDEGAESVKHEKQKGEKVHEVDTQVKDILKNQYSKANDESKFVKKDHDIKSQTEGDAYEGHNSKQDKAEESEANGFKRGHKKGHHKQGFQNHYHKDEASNKSTFFDDFNDEGDQAAYKSRLSNHDDQGGRSYHGSHNNGKEYVRDDYHTGGHNRYGENGLKHSGHQDHGRKYYLDDNDNYHKYHNGRNNYDRTKVHDRYDQPVHDRGWGWQKWDNRRDWERPRDPGWDRDPGWSNRGHGRERDYGGPGYYDDHGLRHDGGYGHGPNHGYGYGYSYDESRANPVAQIPKDAPVVAHRKQTITIYEDPRYDGKDKGKLRREEGDYLELEYRPSGQRYATYDDTYYAAKPATAREGGVESSKINRLVYNYRRQ